MVESRSSRFLSSWYVAGRMRPVLQATAMAVGAALVVTLGSAEPARADAKPVVSKAQAQKVGSRPDVVSAQVTARAQGSRVEVESLRDATSTTWVNPDGTLTTRQHQGPIRFRDASGGWRDVDLELSALADGTVAPKGHPLGLSLAGEAKGAGGGAKARTGTNAVAAHERPGKGKQAREVVFGWGKQLGTPSLSGTTATYRDVEPGVDLTVEARRSGFETHLVVKTPAALAAMVSAAGAAPVSWQIPVKTKGLTARAERDGSVSFVDADGQVASAIPAPVAWDATVDPRSGNHTNVSPVAMSVRQQGKGRAILTLTPDRQWLTDPARAFPVTIDPTYASGSTVAPVMDTYVSSLYSTTTYATSTELRVGTFDGGGDRYRSFLRFPLASFTGKDIVSANLSLYEFHSYSCTAKPFYAYNSNGATASTTWATQPSVATQYGSLSVAKGFSSSCAAGRVSVPVTSILQAWSGSTSTEGTIRLSASETDSYAWKKFYSVESSQDPYLTFTYNRKPNAASAPTVTGWNPYLAPGTTSTYNFTNDPTPTFHSKATDPDGNKVALTVEVHNSTAGTSATKVASCVTVMGEQATDLSCTVPALTNSTTYWARVAVKDERGLWNGTWSPWTRFFTSWSIPPAPTVSCNNGYLNNTWTTAKPTSTVTCTVTAAGVSGDYDTPGWIALVVDGTRTVEKISPPFYPSTTSLARTFAVDASGAHTITAQARSRSEIDSAPTSYAFGWGGAALSQPTAPITTSGAFAIGAGGPPRAGSASVTGTIQWRLAGGGGDWVDAGAPVTVTAPNSAAPVQWNTSWSPASIPETTLPRRKPVTLEVQVCLTYAGVTAAVCTWANSPITVTRSPHAFGDGYPTADAGPGQVGLYTGELNTTVTDVSVPGYSGDLSVGRTHSSFNGDGTLGGWAKDAATGVFGPGWTATLQGPNAGVAGMQVIDNTRSDGTIVLVDEQGAAMVYRTPSKDRAYTPNAEWLAGSQRTVDAGAHLTVTGDGSGTSWTATTMTFTGPDGSVTTWTPKSYSASKTTAYQSTATIEWVPSAVQDAGPVGATTYVPATDGSGRVTRIIAALPQNAVVACATSGSMVRGCRSLDIEYATATSPTLGDYEGQVKSISATTWDPTANNGAGAMMTTAVARYAYDSSGRLVSVTDPRTGLATTYAWDGTSTRLASVTPPGLATYQLTYDTTVATAPKVSMVTRDNPAGVGSGVTLSRYVYGVPLSGTGLPDVSATAVGLWNQASAPTAGHGYAVFGADYTGPASGSGVDWTYADLQYTDDQGYTVDTASYGAGAWQLTATDYDTNGNTIRQLNAGAITTIQGAAAGRKLTDGQVDALSTQTLYEEITNAAGKVISPAGTLVTDTYGPARDAALADGTVQRVRPTTHTRYDENAPNVVDGLAINPATDEPWRLPTTVITGVADAAAVLGSDDIETTSTTINSYAKLSPTDASEGDPWALGTPAKVTTGGITRTTRYDTEGRTTEVRQPGSIGGDAGTTKTVYYTAGINSADAACGNHLEWAGLVCRTLPAAAPSAGADGAGTLPDSRTTAYTAWLQPLTVVETSGSATRTTQTRYDAAGRTTATWATVDGLTGSTPRPGTFTHYIPAGQTAAGAVDYSGNLILDAGAIPTGADPSARSGMTYDAWGRVLTVTNDLGEVTTTNYVVAGQPGAGGVASVVDAKGATAYGYDGFDAGHKAERRGKTTTMTITRAGAAGGSGTMNLAAAYDADGNLVTQQLPGKITQLSSYDEAGEPQSLTYTGTVQPVTVRTDGGDPVADENGDPIYDPNGPAQDNQPWLTWSIVNDAQGRVRTETTGPAPGFDGVPGVTDPKDITPYDVGAALSYDRTYAYDGAGRLSMVIDHTATSHGADLDASPCLVRTYAFDTKGRRTGLSSATHGDGVCDGSTSVTTTSASFNYYDTADRPTAGQNGAGTYVYDALGRQTTVPSVDTPAYANDRTIGAITLGYFDDDLPRSISQGTATTTFTLDSAGRRLRAATTTSSGTSTLVRHYTDGSDNPAWTDEDGTITRYAESIGGDLGMRINSDGSADLTLANLHGDVVTAVPITATAPDNAAALAMEGWSDYDEYGILRNTTATGAVAGTTGYGWLGAKQRSTTTAGLTLMGVRLYNPVLGSFSSRDRVPNGNSTAYAYPQNPIGDADTTGLFGCGVQYRWGYKKINCTWSRAETAVVSWLGIPAAKYLLHYIKNPWAALAFAGGSALVIRTAWLATLNHQRLAMSVYATYNGYAYWATVWRTRS